jgi:hypothetical protein
MNVRALLPLGALLGLGLAVTSCADTPTEPALRDAVTAAAALPPGWVAMNFTTGDQCNGELVDFTTRRIDRVSLKQDGAGGFHFSVHRTWIGTGVGQISGTEYTFNWPNEISEHFRPPFPYSFTRAVNNNLVSKGNADNRIFRAVFKFTVNANGEVVNDFVNSRLECVG